MSKRKKIIASNQPKPPPFPRKDVLRYEENASVGWDPTEDLPEESLPDAELAEPAMEFLPRKLVEAPPIENIEEPTALSSEKPLPDTALEEPPKELSPKEPVPDMDLAAPNEEETPVGWDPTEESIMENAVEPAALPSEEFLPNAEFEESSMENTVEPTESPTEESLPDAEFEESSMENTVKTTKLPSEEAEESEDAGLEEPFEEPAPDVDLTAPEENIPVQEMPEPAKPASEPIPIPSGESITRELPASQKTAKPKGDRAMIIFGGIVLLFAVFGLICSIVLTTKGIHKLMEKPNLDGEYEWLLTPLVLQDPPQFASPEKISDSTLITAGVWRLIINEDVSKYPVDSMNFITVPASDIEVQIKALFGNVRYTHQSVGDTELLIIYNEANRTYEFPAVPHVLAYTPDVEEIVEEDENTLHITVGYIPPGPVWQKDTNGNSYQPAPEKQMTYTLKKAEDGNWRVYAMGSVDGEEDQYPDGFGPIYPEPAVPENTPEEESVSDPSSETDGEDAASEETEGNTDGEESSETNEGAEL